MSKASRRHARRAVPFAPILVLGLLAAFPRQLLAQEQIVRAEKAIEGKDYAGALTLLRQQVDKDPRDYRAWFDIAYAYTMMGERQQAILAYQKTLEVRPQLTQASMNLGILLLEERRGAEAARHLEAVVAARPKDARAQLLLADAVALSGDKAKALEEYNKAIDLDPKSYEAHYALARLLAERNQLAEAEQQLARALELRPGDLASRLEMARLWERTGRRDDAVRLYAELAQKEPGNAAVRRRLGSLLLEQKQFGQAAAEFEAALRAAPSPEDEWNLARAYAGAKQPHQAIPLLRKRAEAEPNNYEAHLLLGSMLTAKRDFPAARKQLEWAAALRPEVPDAYVDLANVLYLQQDFPGTLRVLDRVAQISPPTPWLYFLRAISLDKLDQVEPALESYQRFLAVANGQFPDQEFQARQRSKVLNLRLAKGGRRRKG